MKIVKEVIWTLPFTCSGCKSDLIAEAGDVKHSVTGCYDEFETRYFVECPGCGTQFKIKNAQSTLPPKVYNESKRS